MPQNLGFQVWSVFKMEDNISVPYLSAALGAPVFWTSVIIKNMFNIAGNKQIKEKSAFDIWNVWYPKPLLTISQRHYSSQCALITCLPDLTHQVSSLHSNEALHTAATLSTIRLCLQSRTANPKGKVWLKSEQAGDDRGGYSGKEKKWWANKFI